MKLLLHTCCAPCLIYPLEQLQKKGSKVSAFFYNPNIYPQQEYEKRKQALEDYNKIAGIEIIYPEYQPDEYAQAVGLNQLRPQRCSLCWALRLRQTAQTAREMGFALFSSTLLVSPHQDQEELKRIGYKAAEEAHVDFYYEDFRPGYRQAHSQANLLNIYCQKYCGCIYSLAESRKKNK